MEKIKINGIKSVSVDLLENTVFSINTAYSQEAMVLAVIKFTEFLEALGWAEHTGDWDPYIQVEEIGGWICQSEHGYLIPEYDEETRTLRLLGQNTQGDEVALYTIDIMEIRDITFNR
jgi:hypothetical protein